MTTDPVVAFFYDEDVTNYCLGGNNPMRPHRARLTNSLVTGYGLRERMKVFRPVARTFDEITHFHADEYVEFLRYCTPDNFKEYEAQMKRFNLGVAGFADCPVFDGMFEYCSLYSGASVGGAAMLARGEADVCVNWSGGMHHAKKAEASGFCYINDIVLGIVELLKVFHRVLYVDIDIHHGDGVEEAFYTTDRVFTVSFHKYGEFFPGTGALEDIGWGDGKHYSLNVPMKEGMDDETYRSLFEPIMTKVMELYAPQAIVVCAGADSLSGDRLGCFNLSMEGHSNCVEFLRNFGVPMMLLGGGGYTMRNVSRCWTYETARMCNIDLPDELPAKATEQFNYWCDTNRLRIATSNMKNANTKEEVDRIRRFCLESLSQLKPPSGAPLAVAPPLQPSHELPEEDPDVRGGGELHEDMRRVRKGDEEHDAFNAINDTSVMRDRAHSDTLAAVKAPIKNEKPMQLDDIKDESSPQNNSTSNNNVIDNSVKAERGGVKCETSAAGNDGVDSMQWGNNNDNNNDNNGNGNGNGGDDSSYSGRHGGGGGMHHNVPHGGYSSTLLNPPQLQTGGGGNRGGDSSAWYGNERDTLPPAAPSSDYPVQHNDWYHMPNNPMPQTAANPQPYVNAATNFQDINATQLLQMLQSGFANHGGMQMQPGYLNDVNNRPSMRQGPPPSARPSWTGGPRQGPNGR